MDSGWRLVRALSHSSSRLASAPVGDVGQAVPERQGLQFLLQRQQFLFRLIALGDVEHEADQRLGLALVIAHHMDDVAYPHIAVVLGQRPVVRLVVHPGLGLRHAEIHHVVAVVRVYARRPVLHGDPALRAPPQQCLDLGADVGEPHGGPIDFPGNGLGRFQKGPVNRVVTAQAADV